VDPNWTFRWKETQVCLPPEKIRELELDFRMGFLEAALPARSEDRDLLSELGEIYTRRGRVREGLALDMKLARLFPDDPVVNYNLACSLALNGESERSLKAIQKAILRGFSEFELLRTDEDLVSIRALPEFRALLEKAPKIS
jgi:tetratricopeptide (TPR) repeat protein